jgi:hypothetical protein
MGRMTDFALKPHLDILLVQGYYNPIFLLPVQSCNKYSLPFGGENRDVSSTHKRKNADCPFTGAESNLNQCIIRWDRMRAMHWNKKQVGSSRRSRQHDGRNKQGGKDQGTDKDKEEPPVRFFLMRLFFLFHGGYPRSVYPR